MALKGKEAFYKWCLAEVKKHGRFSHLAWGILEKGVGQQDGTRGHVTHAIGVCQVLLTDHPGLIVELQAADPTRPFDVAANPNFQTTLRDWIAPKAGAFGRAAFGYNYSTCKRNTTATLGGTRVGGGGGDDEFKKVLRLMAEFLQ